MTVAGPVYDTNAGAELDLKKVAAARKEELEWVQRQCIYKKVDAEDARKAGKFPITMKWVDAAKAATRGPTTGLDLFAVKSREPATQNTSQSTQASAQRHP